MRNRLLAHLNGPTAWAFIAMAARMASSLVLLPVLLRNLSSGEMGLWYLFMSVGAIAVFADFGITQGLTRSAATLWAGAGRCLPEGLDTFKDLRPSNKQGVSMLVGSAERVLMYLSSISMVVLWVIGFALIKSRHREAETNAIVSLLSLAIICISSTMAIYARFYTSILSGIGGIRAAQKITVLSQGIQIALVFGGVSYGLGLLGAALGAASAPLVELALGRKFVWRKIGFKWISSSIDFTLLKPLLPNAGKVVLIALGTYLVYNSCIIMVSQYGSLSTTAALGLSTQMVNAISQVSGIFIATSVPVFVSLRTSRKIGELKRMFLTKLTWGCVTYILLSAACLLSIDTLLKIFGSKSQVLPMALMMFFCTYRFLEFVHVQHAVLVMTDNVVPFAAPALGAGIIVFLVSLYTVKNFGVWGGLATVATVQLVTNNWYSIWRGWKSLNPVEQKDGAEQK